MPAMDEGHKEGATGQRIGTCKGEMTTLGQEETEGGGGGVVCGGGAIHTHTHNMHWSTFRHSLIQPSNIQ